MIKLCARIALALGLTLVAGSAFAEGFALYEYSARGIALGGATVARQPDPSALAYNPSLITRLKGIHFQTGITAITPIGKMETTDARGNTESTSLNTKTWFVPNLYYTHQVNDTVTLGVGTFSRFGLGFEYPHSWPGRFNVYNVDLQTASIAPTIAIAATDKLSLAIGGELMYVTMDLNKRVAVPVNHPANGKRLGTLEVDSDINDADRMAFGANFSAHYQFNDQWAAGLTYRTKMQVRARGNVEYTNMGYTGATLPPALAAGVNQAYDRNFNDGGAHAEVVLPDSATAGVSWTPIPELSIEAGAIWTRWSTFQALRIHIPQPLEMSESTKDWKDVWRFNLGLEYKPIDWLALRLGYVYDQSPMTEAHEDYLIPTDGRQIYSVGAGFKWDAWTLDLAYAYIDAKGRSYSARPKESILKSEAKSVRTDMISVSVGYEF